MGDSRYTSIGDVVADEAFPEVDLALRRGRHIDRDDGAWYALLVDAQAELEVFYGRYGCELVRKSDGYFYLLPTGDKLAKRHLSVAEMLVGQCLALLLLDPCTVESGGVITRDEVLAHLARVMGPSALVKALNPKKKRLDERVAQETVRTRVAEALRRLASLGFVDPIEGNRLRVRASLMRFAEPVRSTESPDKCLAQLVANGEIAVGSIDDDDVDDMSNGNGDVDTQEGLQGNGSLGPGANPDGCSTEGDANHGGVPASSDQREQIEAAIDAHDGLFDGGAEEPKPDAC